MLKTGFNTVSVISLYPTHAELLILNSETFNSQPKMQVEAQEEVQLEETITLEEVPVEVLMVVELAAPQPLLTWLLVSQQSVRTQITAL